MAEKKKAELEKFYAEELDTYVLKPLSKAGEVYPFNERIYVDLANFLTGRF